MKRLLLFFILIFGALQANEKPVVLMVGTRPEAIKMIPLYQALKNANVPTLLCSTGQHRELLDEVMNFYGVEPDCDFHLMKPGQDLFHITENAMKKAREFFDQVKPSLVVVQGDTTSAMSSALAAFYLKIPVAHLEAGLRSHNLQRPFPEELNRRVISLCASLHFAPTEHSAELLRSEGFPDEAITITGNTVVDALYGIVERVESGLIAPNWDVVGKISEQKKLGKKIMLLTAHRRESFDGGIEEIFKAVKRAMIEDPNLFVFYPRHPNPAITKALTSVHLDEMPGIHITSSIPYQDLVYVMNACDLIATDSGGIQEEGVSLGKPTFVLRNETDRPEGLKHGTAVLVGTDQEKIFKSIQSVKKTTTGNEKHPSPYGDGHAAEKCVAKIKEFLR